MKREAQLTIFLLILAAIFGLYARLAVPVRDNFPLLDGGLFYAMARDLLANDFHWPLTTSYNQLDIPFAYPPLGIFLLAWLHRLSGVNLLVLMRWIPALVSLLTLPMVYLLARQLLESAEEAALATLLFATLPRAYEWIIMGGGVTRAPGTLFYIAFAWAAYQAFSHRSWKMAIWAGLFGGLVVLTHPERALHAAAAGLLFWLWLERSRQGTLRALLIGGGTLLVSAPWWGTVLTRYGGGMLTLAAQAGGPRWLFWAPLLQLDFTDEILPLTALLAIYGAFLAWKDGQRLLPVWFVLVFLSDPRSAPHVVGVQTSLLAAIGLSRGVLAVVEGKGRWQEVFQQARGRAAFAYLIVLLVFNVQSNVSVLHSHYVLPEAEQKAMQWVARETPSESRFLVLGWEEIPGFSPLLEWFPALSERGSASTLQGREWLTGKANFVHRVKTFPDLYACLDQEEACLERWATENDETFEYVYLSLLEPGGKARLSRLADALRESPNYHLIYETPEVLIFERLP